MGIGPRLAKRLCLPAILAFTLAGTALIAPGTAGALEVDRPAVTPATGDAEAAGSKLGRVPTKCRGGGRRNVIRVPSRFFRCLVKRYRAAEEVMGAFMGALVSGDGTLACTLMTPEERARRGGPACAVNVEAASEGFGLRRAEAFLSGVRLGKAGKSEFVVFLRKPRELAILQMEIVNRHYFRLSYTRELLE